MQNSRGVFPEQRRGEEPLPHPAGHTALDEAQAGLLGCQPRVKNNYSPKSNNEKDPTDINQTNT